MLRSWHFFFVVLFAATTSLATAQSDNLRLIEFDVPGDFFADVILEVNSDDVSVLFNVIAEDPEDTLYLIAIEDVETGEILYDIDTAPDDHALPFPFEPISDGTGELAVFIPNIPDTPLEAGTYLVVFEAETSTITNVQAYVRSGPVDVQQALDVVIWNVTDELLDSTAQTIFEASIVREMNAALNPHQLQVGEVRIVNANDQDFNAYAFPAITEDDISSLNEVCAVMSERITPSLALHVALVSGFDEVEVDAGSTAGIAINAGNAGTILQVGSRNSCVVVSYEVYGEDYASHAINILHEGAHFMSLPHTTEADGAVFDLFVDTPECDAAEFDGDDDGFVDDFECDVEGGANNVLFWSGDEAFAPFTFSNDQAWVMRRHPFFQPLSER